MGTASSLSAAWLAGSTRVAKCRAWTGGALPGLAPAALRALSVLLGTFGRGQPGVIVLSEHRTRSAIKRRHFLHCAVTGSVFRLPGELRGAACPAPLSDPPGHPTTRPFGFAALLGLTGSHKTRRCAPQTCCRPISRHPCATRPRKRDRTRCTPHQQRASQSD